METKKESRSLKLIVSDDEAPMVKLTSGMHLQVETVQLIGDDINERLQKIGARLCGGSGTCLAVIEV